MFDIQKKRAVFLDRDGVLTVEKSYVSTVNDLEIFPYVAQCVSKMHEKGYYAVVITNQSGIARGLFSEKDLSDMNRYLEDATGVDAIYYCPHHPEGIVPKYRKICNCRKPDIGMIVQASYDFQIDLSESYFVGDRASDIMAGKRAGMKTVLLESGYGTKRLEEDVVPDFVMHDLCSIIKIL